ncbi:unnamed protein product, partial [Amoebophrya sp. A120]
NTAGSFAEEGDRAAGPGGVLAARRPPGAFTPPSPVLRCMDLGEKIPWSPSSSPELLFSASPPGRTEGAPKEVQRPAHFERKMKSPTSSPESHPKEHRPEPNFEKRPEPDFERTRKSRSSSPSRSRRSKKSSNRVYGPPDHQELLEKLQHLAVTQDSVNIKESERKTTPTAN